MQLDKEKQHNVNEKNSLQKYQWSVQKISLGLKDLINVISEENTNFKELVASTRTLVNEYFENTNLTIHFTDNVSTIKRQNDQIEFKLKRTIHAMVKEILQNILKHSQADTIWFDIQMTNNNSLSFAVSDNGIGFNYSFNLQGHGLKNIEKRATDINAQLSILSHPGSGTTIKIEIPLKPGSKDIYNITANMPNTGLSIFNNKIVLNRANIFGKYNGDGLQITGKGKINEFDSEINFIQNLAEQKEFNHK